VSEPEQFVRPSSIEIHVHPMCAGGVSELSVLTRLAGFPAETDHSGSQVCSHAKIRASTSTVASLQRTLVPCRRTDAGCLSLEERVKQKMQCRPKCCGQELSRVGIPRNLLPDDQAVWWPRKVDLCGL
jgi:hypothetical protein